MRIVVVVIEGFADWEYGLLAASARAYLGGEVIFASPGGRPVSSMAGLAVTPQRAIEDLSPADFDALVVIGSEGWVAAEPRGTVAALLRAAHAAGRTTAGICGGTLALAAAGLFDGRPHTSNAREFLVANIDAYAGDDSYVETRRAVASDRVISAPGTAPASFAFEVLAALWPEAGEMLAGYAEILAAEHRAAPVTSAAAP